MKFLKSYLNSIVFPLTLLSAAYVSVALYLGLILKYEFLRSDVLGYWQDSLNWKTPFNPFHVPGYPLIIAGLRGATGGKLPPILSMMLINWAAFLACAASLYQSLKITGMSEKYAALGVYLFGLWPFVGLVYTVDPLSDMPAMAFFLTGLLSLLYSRKWLGAVLLGVSLITHKAMWLFVALLIFAYLYKFKPRKWKDLAALALLMLPLFSIWMAGVIHTGAAEWLISSSANIGSNTRNTIPIFEGIIGTIQQGGAKGLLKGGLVIAFLMLSILLNVLNYKFTPPYFEYSMAICTAVLFLIFFLTHIEIWAAVRFGRLLALPLIWFVSYLYNDKFPVWLTNSIVFFFLAILLSTQFIYSWYMAKIFFN